MKRFASLVLIATLSSGCATTSAWWTNFKNDPSAQVQSVLASVEIVKTVATATFEAVKAQLPAASQAQAETDFQKALLTVANAESAVEDAVSAAVAAQQSSPDFTKVFADLAAAVGSLQDIVNTFKAQAPAQARPGVQPGSDALEKQVTALKARLARH